jgi:hypothetical protein
MHFYLPVSFVHGDDNDHCNHIMEVIQTFAAWSNHWFLA